MGLRVRPNLITVARTVRSVNQGAKNRIFMSVVVISTPGPVSVMRANAAAESATVMSSPPRFNDRTWILNQALVVNHAANLTWFVSTVAGGIDCRFIPKGALVGHRLCNHRHVYLPADVSNPEADPLVNCQHRRLNCCDPGPDDSR